MNRTVKAIGIFLLFASPATAKDTCDFIEGAPENCVRFAGCVNNGTAHFYGTAVGWDAGSLYGITSNNAACQGDWTYSEFLKRGQGVMECSDGPKTQISFFARSQKVEVFKGIAINTGGERMTMWTGENLLAFFEEQFPDGEHPGFQCGETWVKLPTPFPGTPKK